MAASSVNFSLVVIVVLARTCRHCSMWRMALTPGGADNMEESAQGCRKKASRVRIAITVSASRQFPGKDGASTSLMSGVNAMRHMEQCLQVLAKTTMTTREKLTLLA